MEHDEAEDQVATNVLLARVPHDVLQSLNEGQRTRLANAMRELPWRRHPVDIRLSLPFFKRRFYLTIVGGEEKRSRERRLAESELRPVRTMGNVLFVLGIAALFYLLTVVGIFFYSEVVEL